ncbi:MAG: 50S ribosomal protein L18 [Candidatus Omnitrophica bacterium]|nr:50S ribosomal protein L18 [Candidatus Omnitrophota bacterium]
MRKITGRERRHRRIRKKLFGTPKAPRLVIYRSLKNLRVALVDDAGHKTLMSVSTITPGLRDKVGYGGNVKAAGLLGEFFAKKALEKGIDRVVFDRSGYMYHGRIKALAESVLKNGLSFGLRVKTNKKK